MSRTFAIALIALSTMACNNQERREERAEEDARDVERVEAAQNVQPPIRMLAIEPITKADIEKAGLLGANCTFVPPGKPGTYVVLAMADAAYLKVEGELGTYAADKGSPPLPLSGWTRYEGRSHIIDLQIVGGEGTQSGEKATDWPGRLSIRDPYSRLVYSAAGTVRCGA